MILRSARRGGVLPCTLAAPTRLALLADPVLPEAWVQVSGTPICLGENDIHGDCVAVMAFNIAAVANARRGIFAPFDDTEPLQLYETLGGMPADCGLDPAVLFRYWAQNPIGGYKMRSIETILPTDFNGIKQALVDDGYVGMTAMLQQPQMTQKVWSYVPGAPNAGGHAFVPSWYEGPYAYDYTWGEEIPMEWDFIAKQAINVWRIDLDQAE